MITQFRVRAAVAKSVSGEELRVRRGDTVYLTMADDLWRWTSDPRLARVFDTQAEALDLARQATGPWYFDPDPETIEVQAGYQQLPQPARFYPGDSRVMRIAEVLAQLRPSGLQARVTKNDVQQVRMWLTMIELLDSGVDVRSVALALKQEFKPRG